MTALSSTTAKIANASYGSAASRSSSHSAAESAAAMRRRTTSTSPNWARNFFHPGIGSSTANSLRPSRPSRLRASAPAKPSCASVPSAAITASAGCPYSGVELDRIGGMLMFSILPRGEKRCTRCRGWMWYWRRGQLVLGSTAVANRAAARSERSGAPPARGLC